MCCRHVPAPGQDAQAGLRLRLSVRNRQRLHHLRGLGVARARARLPTVARLADRLRVVRLDQAGPRQPRHQEAGAGLLLVDRCRQAGPQVQPGQDLQVSAASLYLYCIKYLHLFCIVPLSARPETRVFVILNGQLK